MDMRSAQRERAELSSPPAKRRKYNGKLMTLYVLAIGAQAREYAPRVMRLS